jgi:hypothetical protein
MVHDIARRKTRVARKVKLYMKKRAGDEDRERERSAKKKHTGKDQRTDWSQRAAGDLLRRWRTGLARRRTWRRREAGNGGGGGSPRPARAASSSVAEAETDSSKLESTDDCSGRSRVQPCINVSSTSARA